MNSKTLNPNPFCEEFADSLNKSKLLQNEAVDSASLFYILDNLDGIVYVSDIKTYELLYLNQNAKLHFGDSLGQKCWAKMQISQNEPCTFCSMDRITDSEGNPIGPYVFEFSDTLNDRWYESHSKAITWTDGRIVKLEMLIDITDRKRDEKRMLKLLNQQTLISKISNVFITTSNFEKKMNDIAELIGKQLTVSRVFVFEYYSDYKFVRNTFEWCNTEILPKKDQFQNVDSELFSTIQKHLQSKGSFKAFNVSNELPKEIVKFLVLFGVKSLLVTPIFVNQKMLGFIGIEDCMQHRTWHILEISLLKTVSTIVSIAYERKFIEEAIIKSEQKLREANASKDKFFSIIAHDLKNPIYNLTSLAEFLLDNFEIWDAAKTKQFISYIYQSSKQGFNLLENLLEWSRSQTGKIVLRQVNFDLSEIVKENIDLSKATARNKSIELINKVSDTLMVFADINMVNTVVRNLISNALKFTKAGGSVTLDYIIHNECIELSITDTGVGISKEDIPKLFKIDVTHSTLGTNEESGTGLGLILCKEFIVKNKGVIRVESEVNMGTKFIITVPKENPEII